MNNAIERLAARTSAHRFTRASFRTLRKHAASGAFDTDAAMRLLRRNVRDVAPGATVDTQQRVASVLLAQFRADSE